MRVYYKGRSNAIIIQCEEIYFMDHLEVNKFYVSSVFFMHAIYNSFYRMRHIRPALYT
jgi:hypothetical protein